MIAPARAQEDAPPDSPYVRLLKSGRLPAERLGVAIDGIGQRGGVNDLAYLLGRAVEPKGFPAPTRAKVLDVLAEAAINRKLRPTGELGELAKILAEPGVDATTLRAAIRLAGVWKLAPAAGAIRAIAADPKVEVTTRASAFDALASLGAAEDRAAIEKGTADSNPAVVGRAVAALARLDVDAAADRAAKAIGAAKAGQDLAPLIAAFVDLQGGADKLAAALGRSAPSADAAKLALRALYALGRADEALVASLSKAAGIEAETKPLSPAEMEKLVAEVAKIGDPARGEAIFRRAELNCMQCHSIANAAGGVGPDLSAVGASSPIDYLVNSILLPDLAIKEVYETLMVLTDDGRIFQGIVVDKDDQKIVLRDATAEIRSIPTASVEESKTGGSLMPKGLANLLTRAEFVDLVRFLSELGKPGPYAIESTPTIHRWRIAKANPGVKVFGNGKDGLTEVVPNEVPGDDWPWIPSYSRVNGELPLEEVVAATKSPGVFLQGEVIASAAGPVSIRLDSPQGVIVWLDDKSIEVAEATTQLAEGRHKITLHVDTKARKKGTIKVEVVKPAGSSAEYTIVGGR